MMKFGTGLSRGTSPRRIRVPRSVALSGWAAARKASCGQALLIDATSRPRLVCASVALPQNAAARAGVRHECAFLGSVDANPRAGPVGVGPAARGCAAVRLV